MGRRWWDCVDFWSDCSVTQPPPGVSLLMMMMMVVVSQQTFFAPAFVIDAQSPTLLLLAPIYLRLSLLEPLLSSRGDWTQPLRCDDICTSGCVCYRIVIRRRRSKSEATIFSKFPIPFTIVQHSVSSFWRWWSSFRHRHLRRRRRHLHTRTTRPRLSNHSSIHLSSIHSFVRRGDSNHICGGPTNTFCGVKH